MFRAILTFLPSIQHDQELINQMTTALEQAIAIVHETSNDVISFENFNSRENLEGCFPAGFNLTQQPGNILEEDAVLNSHTAEGDQDNPELFMSLPEDGDRPTTEDTVHLSKPLSISLSQQLLLELP